MPNKLISFLKIGNRYFLNFFDVFFIRILNFKEKTFNSTLPAKLFIAYKVPFRRNLSVPRCFHFLLSDIYLGEEREL